MVVKKINLSITEDFQRNSLKTNNVLAGGRASWVFKGFSKYRVVQKKKTLQPNNTLSSVNDCVLLLYLVMY